MLKDPCRIANGDHIVRDVFCDDRSRTNHGVLSNRDARKDRTDAAQPDIFL